MARVVVTGMGVASPLGVGVQTVWQRLIAGQSGIRSLPNDLTLGIPVHCVGRVPNLSEDPIGGLDTKMLGNPKPLKRMDRFTLLALHAAQQALDQAGWHPEAPENQNNTAVVVGTSVGGWSAIVKTLSSYNDGGARRISPFSVPSFLASSASSQISLRHQLKGPIGAPITACAAGLQAIGDSMRLINNGEANIAVCGGTEACLDKEGIATFYAARALSKSDQPADQVSRPFDRQRSGVVMGEGAGILVIERLEHALARGATPLAEVVGYGTSSDAYHLTAGPTSGEGAARAMRRALRSAALKPSDIGYVNAHATSTRIGDLAEIEAMKSVFGPDTRPTISSTKSAIGHLLGAAGGVESVFTIQSLMTGWLPPNLNLEDPESAAEWLQLIGPEAIQKNVEYSMKNNFGFGGINASIIYKKWRGQ